MRGNESAFPMPIQYDASNEWMGGPEFGMTIREYAAIHICAGDWASPHPVIGLQDREYGYAASDYVQMADALIAELARTKESASE